MAGTPYVIPRPNSPFINGDKTPTHEWYNFLRNTIDRLQAEIDAGAGSAEQIAQLEQEVQNLLTQLNALLSVTGDGYIVKDGPVYAVRTIQGTAGDIDVTRGNGSGGNTVIDLADVTYGTSGMLQAITLDTKGRVVQTHAVTITGTANRVTVVNGTAAAGQPTIDIAATYVGQTSITTLGTITTGTWNGTVIGPTFGGTGLNSYAAGDLLYGSATNVLARRAIGSTGQILTVVGGVPTWANPATSGTVTSVDVSGGTTGLTTSGGPITSSGVITLSGTLNIANGGTGQTTANAAFNALSPMTTNGDIIYRAGGVAVRLPIGSTGQVLGVTGGLPVWQSAGGTGTVTSITAGTGLVATPTNPITTSGTLAIANTIAAGTSGDARHVPQITYNAQGQLTAVALKNVCPYDSTGLISGGVLSINAGNAALFDLTAGVMLYEDYTNPSEPEQVLVNFGPFTGVSIPGIATRNATYIGIDNTGAINQFADPLTNTQRRSMAFIGALIHSNLSTINAVNDISSTVRSGGNQVQDLMSAIGPLNITGNLFSANGANLMMNKTAGSLFKFGSNFWTNVLDPHVVSLGAQTALTFRYRMSNGTEGANVTAIDPNTYESPLGTLTAVPALINTWHVQRVNIFQSGLVRVQYAQQVYASQAAAIAGISNDPYVTETNIAENGVLRCFLVINRGILNLNTSATFIAVSKFGAASITSAGSVTSVGLAMPAQFAVSNSPVTSAGTLTAAWNNQTANTVLAGPASGSAAAPTFRALASADIPLPTDYISGLKVNWVSTTQISVDSGACWIPGFGGLKTFASTVTITPTIGASTQYHVYAFDNAGAAAIEAVTTAPSAVYFGRARTKTGDTTRRYLGSILTNASSQIVSFSHSPEQGRIDYRTGIGGAPFMVITNGRATSATNISCSAVVPPTAIQVLCFDFNDPTTTVTVLTAASDGAVVPGAFEGFVAAGAQVSGIQRLDSSQAFSYAYQTTPAGALGFTVRVNGYIFER